MATKITNPFAKVRNAKDIAGKQFNAFSWLQSRVKELGGVAQSATKIMGATPSKQFFNSIEIGSMYLFSYSAKHAETLPYWDRFPLILPFHVERDHFKGFNLHYIPFGARFKLIQELSKNIDNKFITPRAKMQYSYGLLKGSSKFDIMQPCIKMYLPNHVRSQFMKIDPRDWGTAVMLPIDQFVGANKSTVWKDSLRG